MAFGVPPSRILTTTAEYRSSVSDAPKEIKFLGFRCMLSGEYRRVDIGEHFLGEGFLGEGFLGKGFSVLENDFNAFASNKEPVAVEYELEGKRCFINLKYVDLPGKEYIENKVVERARKRFLKELATHDPRKEMVSSKIDMEKAKKQYDIWYDDTLSYGFDCIAEDMPRTQTPRSRITCVLGHFYDTGKKMGEAPVSSNEWEIVGYEMGERGWPILLFKRPGMVGGSVHRTLPHLNLVEQERLRCRLKHRLEKDTTRTFHELEIPFIDF